ncbi:MAG: DNA internalization-related competence protein ComEC/Rec2 [Gemmataceae bacterium]
MNIGPSIEKGPAPPTPFDEFSRAPLVPVALALTLGVLADRMSDLPMGWEVLIGAVGWLIWWRTHSRERSTSRFGLLLCLAAWAGAYHHQCRHFAAADDIGHAVVDPPGLARIRATILEQPSRRRVDRSDPFVPVWKVDRGTTVAAVHSMVTSSGWQPASGRIRITVDRGIDRHQPFALDDLRIGDTIEATGMLSSPPAPENPGEFDYAELARDKRLSAELRIVKSSDAVVRLASSGTVSVTRIIASIRGRASRVIDQLLPEREAGLARALLLGDGTEMTRNEWDRYIRTGVVHVLAISGQHLVVLAGFCWILFRLFDMPRRTGAWIVLLLVLGYAAVTGMRPSAFRAAIMVAVACLGLIRRKPLNPANAFALAWIAVIALDPVDLVNAGNLLSFVSVFVLIWGVSRWLVPRPKTTWEQIEAELQPTWLKLLRSIIRLIVLAYLVNAILFLANSPLILSRQNLISPIGLLVGPVLILLSEIALIVGFTMLLVGSIHPSLATPLGWFTEQSLAGCGRVVEFADRMPGGSIYFPSPSTTWLVGFYTLGVLLIFATTTKWKKRLLVGLFVWTLFPLAMSQFTFFTTKDELRVTFLSVGHGGCTVLECPDGRVILYDVGTLAGSDAVRRSVAPFLWHRGIRRIDVLFLSHADVDHFNGVPELLRRFPVGRVIVTPSFSEKLTAEVATTLAAFRHAGIQPIVTVAGDRYSTESVTIDVLHPPPEGPAGIENERSLVLHVTHAGHSILLTGDLEKSGTARVLTLPAPSVDALMAPHHGSRAAFSKGLRDWALPRFVVVNCGRRDLNAIDSRDAGPNITVWETSVCGAVTLHSHQNGLTAEAFRTGDRTVIRHGRE